MTDFTTSFYKQTFSLLNQKLAECVSELLQLQEAKASDSKSSMGDKYETSGEMIQQEVRRWLQVQEQLKQQKIQLEKNQATYQVSEQITLGCIFKTDKGIFYLGVALGKVAVNGNTVFAISSQSPLGKEFFGKKVGENAIFQQQTYQIECLMH